MGVSFLAAEVATASASYADIIKSLGSSMGDLATNTGAMIAAILPVGITVFGMYMLIGYAKKVFKKIAG